VGPAAERAVIVIPLTAILAREGDPTSMWDWFTDRASRANDGAISTQVWLTVWHSALAVLIVVVLTVPVATLLAHFRKAELSAAFFVSIGRAVPTITVVGVAVIVSLRNGFGFEPWPIIVALVLLGIPPVFANTYAAIRGVEPSAVSAAVAMGATHRDVMRQVELPLALPIVLAGIRTATVQIVATEPLGAFFGGEGLGAYLRQGLSTREFSQVQAGAVLVTAVALGAELLWAAASRLVVPKGIRLAHPSHRARRANRPAPV
jgi:osmoprotectant transport system permease protein